MNTHSTLIVGPLVRVRFHDPVHLWWSKGLLHWKTRKPIKSIRDSVGCYFRVYRCFNQRPRWPSVSPGYREGVSQFFPRMPQELPKMITQDSQDTSRTSRHSLWVLNTMHFLEGKHASKSTFKTLLELPWLYFSTWVRAGAALGLGGALFFEAVSSRIVVN